MWYSVIFFLIPLVAWIGLSKTFLRGKLRWASSDVHTITWGEAAIQLAVTSAVVIVLFAVGFGSQTQDYKFVNGNVTETTIRKENCNTYWSDFPDGFCTNQDTRRVRDGQTCSTVDGKTTCRPKYKTQYRSVYPWEKKYYVKSDVGTYQIDRIDLQGAQIPPRYAMVKVGDSVSSQVGYTNYIKGASSSLFNRRLSEDAETIPYPEVYDYYLSNRVIAHKYTIPEVTLGEWNKKLNDVNSTLKTLGANIIVVVTSEPRDFAETLAQMWDAHNINDVVVVIGMSGDNISWVDVKSWSQSSIPNILIRDGILSVKTLDIDKINDTMLTAIQDNFKLQDMSSFEYLKDDIPPPLWAYVIAFIVLLVVTPLVTYFLHKNEIK